MKAISAIIVQQNQRAAMSLNVLRNRRGEQEAAAKRGGALRRVRVFNAGVLSRRIREHKSLSGEGEA
jgi:hypothetical protein